MADIAVRRFDFHRHGHASRRDAQTEPQHLLLDFSEAGQAIEYHAAGEDWVRTRPVLGVLDDAPFLSGFSPGHAARIGAAAERARAEHVGEHVRALRRVVEPG